MKNETLMQNGENLHESVVYANLYFDGFHKL